MIGFDQPLWLLLALPLAVAFWFWRTAALSTQVLRGLLAVVVLLALAGLYLRKEAQGGLLVAVLDRSASMPEGTDARQQEVLNLLSRSMRSGDRLGVVGFGEGGAVEGIFDFDQRDSLGAYVPPFEIGNRGSDLAEGLQAALRMADGQARMLVVSDGRWTGRHPQDLAARAAADGVVIDTLWLGRDQRGDLAVESLDLPQQVAPGEAFLISAWLSSPAACGGELGAGT